MSDDESDLDDLEDLLEEFECPLACTPPSDDVNSNELDQSFKSPQAEYQKCIWQLELLPYYQDVQKEADEQWAAIKSGLGRAVMARDIRPGALHWICELDKYLNLYGRRFIKRDHLALVHLVYSLVIIPDLDFKMVKIFSTVLSNLLIKRELLSRSDLVLEWRPLYDKYCFVSYKNLEEDGTFLLTENIQSSLETLIVRCRAYFSLDSTQEILDEIRPYMCPWDTSMHRAITCLSLFVPTTLSSNEHLTHGWALWWPEIMQWYSLVQNSPPWETRLCQLVARLARAQIGRLEWPKYYDLLFTRLLRSFGLAIGKGDSMVLVGPGARGFNIESACVFIASSLGGPNNLCQDYLCTLLKSVESYLHPSNYSFKYVDKLLTFMHRLTLAVCERMNKERYKRPDWQTRPESDWLLTDKQVEGLVESMLPCSLLAMFSKHMKQDLINHNIRHLGQLAPHLVLPAVLEKLYPALDSLTEPHRLYQSLNCLIAVIMPLVRDEYRNDNTKKVDMGEYSLSSLRMHVIPLMNAVLPGLDPNDFRKSAVTFQIISLFCALVPIVDCSDAPQLRDDLTEEEREVCSATATLEQFVCNLLERVFNLLSMASHGLGSGHHGAAAKGTVAGYEESFLKGGVTSIFRSLLGNCSSQIYEMVVDKFLDYLRDNVFEHRVTAEVMGEVVYTAVRSKPEQMLPRFLEYILERLQYHITPETCSEEQLSETTIFYLILTAQVLRSNGVALVKNKETVFEILKLVMPLKSRNTTDILGQIFEHVLYALSAIHSNNMPDKIKRLDSPLEERLHIRFWAEAYKKEDVHVEWHIPSEDELHMVEDIIEQFMYPIVNMVKAPPKHIKNEELLRQLTIVKGMFTGVASLIPLFDGPIIPLTESYFPLSAFKYTSYPSKAPKLNLKSNLRNTLFECVHSLAEDLLKNREDDTKCLSQVCKIYFTLLFYKGMYRHKLDQQARGFEITKTMIGDVVKGKRSFIEALHIEFTHLQHNKRLIERSGYHFTEYHVRCMKDLVKLSTSHYSVVRREAQAVLESCFNSFPYSYKFVLDDILPLLEKSEHISHEQFKGALFLLSMGNKKSITLRHTWSTLLRVWPAIIKAQHSEKPSIIQLHEKIQNAIVDNIESFQITLQVPDNCVRVASNLWNEAECHIEPREGVLTEGEVQQYKSILVANNNDRLKCYNDLVAELVKLSNDSDLHWRHSDMAQSLLTLLIRLDTHLPAEAVSTLVRLLTHDTLKSRRMAIAFVAAWLKVEKQKGKKVALRLASSAYPTKHPLDWGIRPDNCRIVYHESNIPCSKEMYDKTEFVEKQHLGFYCWPKEPKTYAPIDEQPKWNRSRGELRPSELPVYDAFTNAQFVRKFCDLLSLEEKKGSDMFLPMNYQFFKGLLRAFGDAPLAALKPIIEEYINSDKEGQQRMCSEFVAGAVQGSKLWPFEPLRELEKFLSGIVRKAIEKLTSESFKNWGGAIATISDSRDPRRLKWIVDILFDFVVNKGEASPFHVANRFYLVQGLINQMEWKAIPLWRELLKVIEPLISQPYQNLRDRLGSCLSTIVWFDLPGVTVSIQEQHFKPISHRTVIDIFKPHLKILWNELENASPGDENNANDNTKKADANRQSAILALKTLLCYLNSHWAHCLHSMPLAILELLPLVCYFENETSDDELKKDAKFQLLHGFSRAHLGPDTIVVLLDTMEYTIDTCKWWKTRNSVLRVLQTSLYCNLFLYHSHTIKQRVWKLVEKLIQDCRLEVREAAGETFAGLLHCGYFHVQNEKINRFSAWASRTDDVVMRHAGVIALSSVIKAYPYTVPTILPTTLMIICKHASAPAPINGTVKKTLSEFKRTHQDSWHAEHKQNFSEEQLDVLNDLLISHNYYV